MGGEVMTRRQLGACVIIITGALLAVTQGSHASSDQTLSEIKDLWLAEKWLYFVAGLCCFHFFLAYCVQHHVHEIHAEKIKEGEKLKNTETKKRLKKETEGWKTPTEGDDTEIDYKIKNSPGDDSTNELGKCTICSLHTCRRF